MKPSPSQRTAENTEQIVENTDPSEKSDTAAMTAAKVLLTEGQRRVNLIWEGSQAAIALMVVITTCAGVIAVRLFGVNSGSFPPEWWTIVGLVIGFYFGRTNHSRAGDE